MQYLFELLLNSKKMKGGRSFFMGRAIFQKVQIHPMKNLFDRHLDEMF